MGLLAPCPALHRQGVPVSCNTWWHAVRRRGSTPVPRPARVLAQCPCPACRHAFSALIRHGGMMVTTATHKGCGASGLGTYSRACTQHAMGRPSTHHEPCALAVGSTQASRFQAHNCGSPMSAQQNQRMCGLLAVHPDPPPCTLCLSFCCHGLTHPPVDMVAHKFVSVDPRHTHTHTHHRHRCCGGCTWQAEHSRR